MKKTTTQNRQEKLEAITAQLEQGVKEVFTSDKWTAYLHTMSRFHNYSFQNCILIAMQCPEASLVAGYKKWKTLNRQVMKGQKAINILAPVFRKYEEEITKADGTKETTERQQIISFRTVPVFDLSQTDGEPLPSVCATLTDSVDGFNDLLEKLELLAPVAVTFEEINGGANGYFSPMEEKIVVKHDLPELQKVKTLIHETAHAMLHCTDGEEEKTDRDTKEVEAEAVAYTVLQYLGLDSSDYSFGYIAGWAGEKEVPQLKKSLDVIRRTANTIIEGLEAA